MKRFLLITLAVAVLFGCAPFSNSKVCQLPPDTTSVICAVAAEVDRAPEDISKLIKVANLLLMDEMFTAREVWVFLTRVEDRVKEAQTLNQFVTWDELALYVTGEYLKLSPKSQAALILLSEFFTVDLPELNIMPISDYDWGLIGRAIVDQKETIRPFL